MIRIGGWLIDGYSSFYFYHLFLVVLVRKSTALKDSPYDKDWAASLTVVSIIFLSSLIKKFSTILIGARKTLGQELAINTKLGRNLI